MRSPAVKIGLPLRLMIYLATHPGEELSAFQIKKNFNVTDAYFSLRPYVKNELLSARLKPRWSPLGGRPTEFYYSAGPRLLKMMQKYEVS